MLSRTKVRLVLTIKDILKLIKKKLSQFKSTNIVSKWLESNSDIGYHIIRYIFYDKAKSESHMKHFHKK